MNESHSRSTRGVVWLAVLALGATADFAAAQPEARTNPLGRPDGSYYAAFVGHTLSIKTALSQDGGVTWPNRFHFDHGTLSRVGPAVAAHPSNDRVMLAYFEPTGRRAARLVVKQGGGPVSWASPVPASATLDRNSNASPAISHHRGDRYLLAFNSAGTVATAVFDDSSSTLAPTSPGSLAGRAGQDITLSPAIASNGTHSLLVWLSRSARVLPNGLSTHTVYGVRTTGSQEAVWGTPDNNGLALPIPAGSAVRRVTPSLAFDGQRFVLTIMTEHRSPDIGANYGSLFRRQWLTFTSVDGLAWQLGRDCQIDPYEDTERTALAGNGGRTVFLLEPQSLGLEPGEIVLGLPDGPCPDQLDDSQNTRRFNHVAVFEDPGMARMRPALSANRGGNGPHRSTLFGAVLNAGRFIVTGASPNGVDWAAAERFTHSERSRRGPAIAAHPNGDRLMLAWFDDALQAGGTKLVVKQGAGSTSWVSEPPSTAAIPARSGAAPAMTYVFGDRYALAWNTGAAIATAVFDDSESRLVAASNELGGNASDALTGPAIASNSKEALMVWLSHPTPEVVVHAATGQFTPTAGSLGDTVTWSVASDLNIEMPVPGNFTIQMLRPGLDWGGDKYYLSLVLYDGISKRHFVSVFESDDAANFTLAGAPCLVDSGGFPRGLSLAVGSDASAILWPPRVNQNGVHAGMIRAPTEVACANVQLREWADALGFGDVGLPNQSGSLTVADNP